MEGAPGIAPTFGPFRILSRLGRGGMAETFLVERRSPGGVVQELCLKRILPEMSQDPEWIRFFQKEARTVAKLRHPNIAAVSDVGVEQGIWWMLLELVDGTDLRSLLATPRSRSSTSCTSRRRGEHVSAPRRAGEIGATEPRPASDRPRSRKGWTP